ncbi:M20 family metallopeptidase [Brachybacterium sp. EF45031]|uniref:M20 family metallopeptidase n=1 Tax=Brachybacterium sillae TaxID=2810536 RepID=UPI00217E45A4|nr:M20 family metallopeptidase [Brachybacterium sillae]MCS6711503.1 M20 family metallopeptidase [Brachybacterium sillae]
MIADDADPGRIPPAPSTAYLDELDAAQADAVATQRHPGSSFTGACADLHRRLGEIADELRPELVDLMLDLAAHPETAFEEHRSAAVIADLLTAHGLEVQRGAHGLDTALRAEIPGSVNRPGGSTGTPPVPAILAEYDALPGIGHGCGHNVIAAMGVGGFLALAELAREDPHAVPGRVVFLGTPAEEGHSGKELMAREGAFGDIDLAVMAHAYPYDLADQAWLGRRTLTVEFHGHTAHASAQPFMGRNALDAASLMYQGLGLLRQQMPPTDRLHAVIREGGDRASVIPDLARLDLYVRSLAPATLRDLSHRVEDVARGAALMTGCTVEVHWDEHPPSLPVRTNGALLGRWVEAQRRRGRDPLPRGAVSEHLAASTDFGNVSYRIPGIHPLIRTSGPEAALHTREFAEAATGELARSAAADGAYGLAAVALDALHDPELARAVMQEFADAGGPVDVPGYFN